jgi:hypothetical protein
MFNKLFSMLGKTESKKGTSLPTGKQLIDSMPPSMVGMMRKFAYQEAHSNFPEKLFADPIGVIESISKGATPDYGNWEQRTLKNGRIVYLTKYPDYPVQPGEAQAGVGAIIVNPSDPSNPEYLVMNVGLPRGPRVRKAFLNEDGNLCSAQDGPGCENSIEAFFQLLDSGKSGKEREEKEAQTSMDELTALIARCEAEGMNEEQAMAEYMKLRGLSE